MSSNTTTVLLALMAPFCCCCCCCCCCSCCFSCSAASFFFFSILSSTPPFVASFIFTNPKSVLLPTAFCAFFPFAVFFFFFGSSDVIVVVFASTLISVGIVASSISFFFLLFNKFFDCKDSPNRSKISLPVLFCPALTSKILNPNSLATARIVAVFPLPESPKTINPFAMFAPEPSPKPSFFSPSSSYSSSLSSMPISRSHLASESSESE